MRSVLLFMMLLCFNTTVLFASPPTSSYKEVLKAIKLNRIIFSEQNISKDSCRNYLLDQFENHVFPHWVGTQWDYNGYTNEPGNDKLIACGYFVSTTLKHMGFKWDRYKLAKMYSLDIVKNTCSEIKQYAYRETLIKAISKKPDNLYIVGLDSHVGFILKSNNRVWFVHSNYYGSIGPEKELASESPALNSSSTYYIGTFFNDANLEKWLNGSAYSFTKTG